MDDDQIFRAERGLIAAHKAGDTRAIELFKTELAALRSGAATGDGDSQEARDPTAARSPSLSQGQANAKLGEGLKSSAAEFVTKTLPQVGASAVKGLGAIGTIPMDAARSGYRMANGDNADFGRIGETYDKAVDAIVPPPETKPGRRAVQMASGALQGAAFPGSIPRNVFAATVGTAGGIAGQEAGQKLGGDNGAVIGGVMGQLLGTPSLMFKGTGNANQMAKEGLAGLTPADFANAKRLQQAALSQGVSLTPEQLFANAPGLDALTNALMQGTAGKGKLQTTILQQPAQVEVAARGAANRFGPNVGAYDATRDMRLATQGVIEDTKLTKSQKALFDESGKMLNAPQIQEADGKLSAAIKGLQASEARKPLEEFQQLLRKIAEYRMEPGAPIGPMVPGATGGFRELPLTGHLIPDGSRSFTQSLGPEVKKLDAFKAPDLDVMVKEALLKLKDLGINQPGLAKRQQGQLAGVLTDIRGILDDITPTRIAGREMEASRHQMRDAKTSGLIGKFAGKQGVVEGAPDPNGLIRSTLGASVPQDRAIGELSAALLGRAAKQSTLGNTEAAAQATRALPQAVRMYWDEALDAATKQTGGRTPADLGSRFYSNFVGSPGSAKEGNFRQMLQGVAASTGQDPAALDTGFKTLLEVMNASGRNRSGLAFGASVSEQAGSSLLGDAVRTVNPFGVLRMTADKLDHMGKEAQLRKLSEMFTRPDALQILEKIGKTPIVSSRQGDLITKLFTTLRQPAEALNEAEASKKDKPNGP